MKRAPITYRARKAPPEAVARLREIERDFHVRAFGEELARVNLDMTKEERIRYIDWMIETARKHGVKPEMKFPYDRDFE
jgi:hypothetical protein